MEPRDSRSGHLVVYVPLLALLATGLAFSSVGRVAAFAQPAHRGHMLTRTRTKWPLSPSPGRLPISSSSVSATRNCAQRCSTDTSCRMAAEGQADENLAQVWASSISTKKELVPAIAEAAAKALAQLPEGASIDLALIHVSSIYGNAERLENVVPELKKVLPGLSAVVGCSSAGAVGMQGKGRVVEIENRSCLGLTLATLPGVKVQPFYLADMDVPDPFDPPAVWKRAVQLRDSDISATDAGGDAGAGGKAGAGEPIFLSYSTTASIDALGDYMAGMDQAFPRSQKIGSIASTVSSLTRSCVFFGEGGTAGTVMEKGAFYREGMVGVSLTGDIRMRSFVSQGARRVGPTFNADKVDGPMVKSLRVAVRGADDEGQDDWISPALPPLAMIKQVQKKLSDEDKRLVQTNMLVGVAPELIGNTANEIMAISTGRDHFVVQGVLRTSLKDGSITVGDSVEPGARLQLFVRDRLAAGDEFRAALLAYKRRELLETLASSSGEGASDARDGNGDIEEATQNVGVVDSAISGPSAGAEGQTTPFRAAGALLFPGLDRGRTLWEEDHYQSSAVFKTVPVPLGGFFTNGVAGALSEGSRTTLFGSSTSVAVFSPITARRTTVEPREGSTTVDDGSDARGVVVGEDGEEILGDDSDDFVVQRRDVKAGRAVMSGPVLYSVAESVAQPRNTLEALVWEKEAAVDRSRDRWPMSLLVSRCRLFNLEEKNKPRDVVAALNNGKGDGGVSILAEVKRTAPVTGKLRRGEFDVVEFSRSLEGAGVAAIAVNTDPKFFGCSYEDLTSIRSAVSTPVMCSDVVVYPYQIYQARLAGADALKLIAPALPAKDLMYFHKISNALGMQCIVSVSSVKQMLMALNLPGIRAVSISNRDMATWALDTSRVERILGDTEVQKGLEGKDITLLVEGGLQTKEDLDRTKAAGISCVVVGEAFMRNEDPAKAAQDLLV
ncbi:unnamed protein product [Ectocarpus sp. 4 AP-2014]